MVKFNLFYSYDIYLFEFEHAVMEYTIAFSIEININNFISKKICRLYIYTFSHVLMHIYSNSNKGNEISRFFDKKFSL